MTIAVMTKINIENGNKAQGVPFQLGFNILNKIFESTCIKTAEYLPESRRQTQASKFAIIAPVNFDLILIHL